METIAVLEKTEIAPAMAEAAGCCGGAPTGNAEACCKLDEDKKAEGEAGCGCNTAAAGGVKSSCC